MSARVVPRPALLRQVPLDRHVVIEASAGTGKTFALEHLLVELVLAADVRLDQVLVVTFTEKATQELRVRVRGKLEELLRGAGPAADADAIARGDVWTIDAPARGKLERALHAFDGATIATIHAFCARVLRENAFASGRLFEEQQVDGRDALGRALRDALRKDVAPDAERARWLEATLARGSSIDSIEELLWKCVQAHGELRPVFDPAALQAALDAFPATEVQLALGARDVFKSWGLHASTATALGGRLADMAMAVERSRDADGATSYVKDPPDKAEYLIEKLAGVRMSGPVGAMCRAALEVATLTPSLTGALAATLFPPVRAELARRKRSAGLYDFDDMLALVQEALSGPRAEALVAAMRERWRFVLIDEFQDTDETQWDIFRRAFVAPGPGESRVVLVGDPKQSIYRFRGADVQTYLAARDAVGEAGGARLRLDTNFRATARMVDATNALFDPEAASPFFTGAVTHAPVACGRPERELRDPTGALAPPLRAWRFDAVPLLPVLGELVAREIQTLTDPARPWRLGDEPLRHEDVFVLTRTRGEGRALGAALRQAGVPFAFFKEDGLFQTDEAREVRTLLGAVLDPGDRAARLRAWMTRFFALPLEDMERVRDLPATHPYVARLEAWHALGETRDYGRLFQSIVEDSGVVRREIFFGDDERELTNVLHVFELLLEQTRRAPGTLRDLVLWLGGLIDQTRLPLDLEGGVQRLESERRAVQIMTVHKAKGLEAGVVFVCGGLGRWPPGEVHVAHEGARRVAWVGTMPPAVKTLADAEDAEEDQRTMYVALTRAKARLVLPLVVGKDGKAGRVSGSYRHVNQRLAALAAEGSPLLDVATPGPSLRVVSGTGGTDEPWRPPASLLAPAPSGDHAALRAARAGATLTSYTRMRAVRSGARSAWADEPADRRAEKAQDEIDEAGSRLRSTRASGVFVHEVLERAPLSSFAAPDAEAWRGRPEITTLFDDAMRVHRVDPAQRAHAEQLVWAAMRTPVTLPGGARLDGLARADRVAREMDFVFPVEEGGAFVRGALDLTFEHAGRTYFVDWKTDALPDFAPEALARHVEGHYRDQVVLYALATVRLLGLTTAEAYEARFGGLLYCFLRGMDERGAGVWSSRPSWDELRSWERDLQRRLGRRA